MPHGHFADDKLPVVVIQKVPLGRSKHRLIESAACDASRTDSHGAMPALLPCLLLLITIDPVSLLSAVRLAAL
ncbi:hypothetical protein [Cohnella yongneupensis]|uniref:Uncharacterized protein n=1 Tax=Cohnella yongneupensis TaxID=425006 RepID=A0ABW0QTP1_9BACL